MAIVSPDNNLTKENKPLEKSLPGTKQIEARFKDTRAKFSSIWGSRFGAILLSIR